jgi:branched-subunit amino acid ABC-type transport system permease component
MVTPLRKRKSRENKVMMLTLGLAFFLTSLYKVVFDAKLKSLPPNLRSRAIGVCLPRYSNFRQTIIIDVLLKQGAV